MIRINKKIGSAIPDVLRVKGTKRVEKYVEDYNNGLREFDFVAEIYGHSEVKRSLEKLQDYKCCFCESNVSAISHGDVEHYRPKAGWVQGDEPINKPGYFWLAYDWDNLLLSCQICNQKYKKNHFPLITETTRAKKHSDDISKEDPYLIHPVNDDPEEHIEFNNEVPKAKNGSNRGKVTIEKLGLDRSLLNEKRRVTFNTVARLYKTAKALPNHVSEKQEAKNYLLSLQNDDVEYASMLRCFFKKNPIDF
jgi:uncharacterized protein (TIGR02646 family)